MSAGVFALVGVALGSVVTILVTVIQTSYTHRAERRERIRNQIGAILDYADCLEQWFAVLQPAPWHDPSTAVVEIGRKWAIDAWQDAQKAVAWLRLESDAAAADIGRPTADSSSILVQYPC